MQELELQADSAASIKLFWMEILKTSNVFQSLAFSVYLNWFCTRKNDLESKQAEIFDARKLGGYGCKTS